MKAILITESGKRSLPLTQIKSIAAVSQCNLLITKENGEQIQAISVEFQK